MDLIKLIETVKNIYNDAITSEDQEVEKKATRRLMDIAQNSYMDKLVELKSLPDYNDLSSKVESLFNLEMKEYNSIMENLTLPDVDVVNEINSKKYIESVNNFSDGGGSGFYDVGSIVSVKYKRDVDLFLKEIESLQKSGVDIKIIAEEHRGNEKNSSYGTESVFAVVMPSSSYNAYETMMVNKLPEQTFKTDSPALRSNYFIAPLIELRDKIPELTNSLVEIQKEKGKLSHYVFSSLGYSFTKIDTQAGYGRFDKLNPVKTALFEAINYSLNSASLYDNGGFSNYQQPTLLCYNKKEQEDRGISIEDGKLQRFTIKNGLKGYELENPSRKVENRIRPRN